MTDTESNASHVESNSEFFSKSPIRRSANTQRAPSHFSDTEEILPPTKSNSKKTGIPAKKHQSTVEFEETEPLNGTKSGGGGGGGRQQNRPRKLSEMVGRVTQNEAMEDYYKPCHKKKSTKVLICCAASVFLVIFCIMGIIVVDEHYNDRHGDSKKDRPHCPAADFGRKVGQAFNVSAFSNCNDDVTSNEAFTINANVINPHNASQTVAEVYTGMRWQCVEYARRFLVLVQEYGFGYTFESVDGAADIWELTTVQSIWNSSTKTPFLRFPNGNSSGDFATSDPILGDILIYPRQPGGFPFGHVGVIAYINTTHIGIAEQNWFNAPWPTANYDPVTGNHYARVLERPTARSIKDFGNIQINGWMRVVPPSSP